MERSRSRTDPWRALGFVVAGLCLWVACSERAPVIPSDYIGGPTAHGWPPPAVYVDDPFHPANRWFHRSFSARRSDGRIAGASPDEPCSPLVEPTVVDRAEILALVEALRAEPLPVHVDSVTRRILRADLIAQGDFWSRHPGCESLTVAHTDAAKTVGAVREEVVDSRLVPPPLRAGEWSSPIGRRFPGELRGVVRYASDLETADGLRRAVLALQRAGDELVAEAWLLSVEGARIEGSVFRFDRRLWREGSDPWVVYDGEDVVRLRDPNTAGRVVLRGAVDELCTSCHSPQRPFLTP